MKLTRSANSLTSFIALALLTQIVSGQYSPVQHREPADGEIPVSIAGNYGISGATYILTNDISSPVSAVFLGKDVTLDLNGYTITYADGNYGHIPNHGFEDGLVGWDISKAPGAKIESTADVHAFIGKKILRLLTGDEIASGYVFLPVGRRSYFAMCGVTGRYYTDMDGDLKNDMRVSIFVDDEQGNEIECITEYRDSAKLSCPVINRSARLGGGFVYAHLNNLPAGKYRIRIKAENDCLVDEIDIRPSFDTGIGIVEETHPLGHYDHLYNNEHAAFFDYTADPKTGKPVEGIPVVKGKGTITIRNGMIVNATDAVLSWGIQSTAEDTRIIIDNVRFSSSGINTTAVDVEQATITRCFFDINNPFIINRHGSEFYAVDLRGSQASEVSYSDFYGGQGCLCLKGIFSDVHHNFFANRQTVTNHYSVMAMGDGSRIFENRFEPETGSGIEIYNHRNIEIFNNEFRIKASPPSCEYHLHLSTNAIRIADYGAKAGASKGCFGNRIYNNRFYISGMKYRDYPEYIPMASAFFYSASAGDNEVFGNEIFINQKDPETNAEAFAFYIGNSRGGRIFNNRIVSNATPVWVGSSYGKAENTLIMNNTFEVGANSCPAFAPIRMGSLEQSECIAAGTEFRSNTFSGNEFAIDATNQNHSYSVFWTLTINLRDKKNMPVAGAELLITDRSGKEVFRKESSKDGTLLIELPEFMADGQLITYHSPYTLKTGKKKTEVDLKKNSEISMTIK
ncbi:MAG: hypothetical protein RBR81_07855 [Bacteroidales bacterium]|jgi:hypothetical protein|nr:hypothetical protein [Bacteroidales bacterium]